MGFRIFVILMGIRTHGRRPGANEGSASTVWSAEGKRPEFVSAKGSMPRSFKNLINMIKCCQMILQC